jgi:2-dehydro-3-deoxyphosphogluconate aldolase/(4S)-4-hydroxy-2-oxoglutarate aldolase
LKIVPTGGVDLATAADFLKAGCAALGVGGSLLTAEILRTNDWPALTRLAGEYVKLARAAKS